MPFSVAMLSVHTSPLDAPGRTKDAGGMNVYIRQLAQELAHHNINVDIFTRWTNVSTPQIVQLSPQVRIIHIKAGPLAPLPKQDLYQYLPAFTHNIEDFRGREGANYDMIHSHYWLSGVAALPLAHLWDVPHVIMFHTLAHLKQLAKPGEQESPLRLEMERKLIQQADCIIAATSDERMQIMRYCGATATQVEVIPCGVDLRLFVPQDRSLARTKLGLLSDRPVLLFAGRLDPFKGPDLLLQAAAMMEEQAQIVIVGGRLSGDQELQQLQALAKALHIQDRVRFLGAKPQQELPTLYSAADVTVVPSYHEIFGLVAVESLACGTPVVATRAGGLKTIVRHGETGFLVPRCPGFFAERLDTLLRDAKLYSDMHKASRDSVLQFGWYHVASKVQALYNELISSAPYLVAQ